MTVEIVNKPLEREKFYTNTCVSQREWNHILRYLSEDYNVTAGWHPSNPGTVLSAQGHGMIAKYRHLSNGVVYFDAYGDSVIWHYVALLDAVLLGEANMRKEK